MKSFAVRRWPFAVFLFIASVAQGAKQVDIVITGGTVVTMAGPNIPKGGVAIDRGKIVAVGDASKTRAVLAKFGSVQEYDGDGKPLRTASASGQ